ncbi:MAG: GGDEF domain-containing protein [Pseudomonadota bacterium]
MLLMGILLPVFVQYAGWGLYVLARDDREQLIDVAFTYSQIPWMGLLIAAALVLLAVGQFLKERVPDSKAYELLAVMFFALSLGYFGWMIGPLSMPAGAVIMGAPLVGFIVFDRVAVTLGWLSVLTLLVAVSFAAAAGWIAYAPLIVQPAPGDLTYANFWTLSQFFWAAPHMISTFVLASYALARWREREQAFRTLSMTDALTGAHNRRSTLEFLEREVARTRRSGPPLSVLLVDLDHFKRINDTWGHPAGDGVLQQTAWTLDEVLRDYDLVGRWGGEEFLLVLPDTTPETALALAERCRERLAAMVIETGNGQRIPVTGSFGLASNASSLDEDATALVQRADEALYRAKQAGRNRVEVG